MRNESIVQRDVAQLSLDHGLFDDLRRSALSIEEIEAELSVDLDGSVDAAEDKDEV